jgi:hypothetical protein
LPDALLALNKYRCMRAIAVAHHTEQRQHHGEYDALFDAHQYDNARGSESQRRQGITCGERTPALLVDVVAEIDRVFVVAGVIGAQSAL